MGCAQSLMQKDPDIEQAYELTKRLGFGVQGEVWLARHKGTGDLVAIKLVRRGGELGLGPEKLRREIQLQARLSHVNIVELKQVVLTRRHLGIVMSYADGGDLHRYCSRYEMNETVARYIFRQMLAAIDYCHAHRVAHRDLKLANFLLTTDKPMTVKLADFGCASRWGRRAPQEQLARMKTFAGTPAYMSPQVLESAFYPTSTYSAMGADVWSLGILITHMFFDHHTPYWLSSGVARNEGATLQARMEMMRRTHWADSDGHIKANLHRLSPELRDLLDKIFVADEVKRITIEAIQQHPWVNGPLPEDLQDALDRQAEEQMLRDQMRRAAVSSAAGRHDTANAAGDFATIDLLVDLATTRCRMPAGHSSLFSLDMAHIAEGAGSMATSYSVATELDHVMHADLSAHMVSRMDSSGAPDAAPGHTKDSAGSVHSRYSSKDVAEGGLGLYSGDVWRGQQGGSGHAGRAYYSSSRKSASWHGGTAYYAAGSRPGGSRHGRGPRPDAAAGGGSRHGGRLFPHHEGGTAGNLAQDSAFSAVAQMPLGGGSAMGEDASLGDFDLLGCEQVPTTVGSPMFRKALNLQRLPSGMVVASYTLEPSVRAGSQHADVSQQA